VGFTLPDTIADTLATIPESDWQIAYDVDGEPRPGAAAPDYATSRCTSWTRTGSGAPSSPWPASSPPEPSCSPCTHPARRWEPKRLRLRIFSLAGRLTRSGRRTILDLAGHAPWTPVLLQALTTLRALATPG